ncbi:MAG: preprotein translocase subunit YajC [Paludibacterium sp.]|uniref:preprotein translocase subunit YajC n=1 Tax=Paludibacterium sp. TaxID=1917523 RepID=UPI0025E4404B|nr:preprotein translocase subunit YajC [Paludibacterium sp.]MBV8048020.1 preprotein translocase subunit YajC [Paludibacterium sp.]MBV8647507.1 preprotein translocase subunit YajC [Paludibacterium sp.]
MFLISSAFAAGGATGAESPIMQFLPMIVIFALFYLLLIRPQQKKAKETKQMLAALSKGDEVMTQGGFAGRVTKLSDQYATLEIAEGVEIQVARAAITGKLEKGTIKSL